MMTPQEKARELVDKYYHFFSVELENTICIYEAKQCALIAVDLRLDGDFIYSCIEYGENSLGYWEQVKIEIQKL